MTVNKEEILLNWAKQIPYIKGTLLFDWLAENQDSCSIILIPAEPIKTYIDGSQVVEYIFMFCVKFALSDTGDDVNTGNMFTLRQWQDWIEEQEREGNYPDFGDKCSGYELENLSISPNLAQTDDGGMGKYQFPVKLTYSEEK